MASYTGYVQYLKIADSGTAFVAVGPAADDAQFVFDSDTATVTITPDFVRPHLLLVTNLPTSIPLGWNTVAVSSSAGTSEPFPVYVSDEAQYLKRVFNSGTPKEYPYTLAI